jgi:hypothetical protein
VKEPGVDLNLTTFPEGIGYYARIKERRQRGAASAGKESMMRYDKGYSPVTINFINVGKDAQLEKKVHLHSLRSLEISDT